MGASIYEIHQEFVKKLLESGEQVLQPEGNPMGSIKGYIKSEIPHKNAGAIFQDKEGKYGIFGDFGATYITGIEWDDIGLCDTRCWYEWIDNRRENRKIDKEKIIPIINKVDETLIQLDELCNCLTEIRNYYNNLLKVK